MDLKLDAQEDFQKANSLDISNQNEKSKIVHSRAILKHPTNSLSYNKLGRMSFRQGKLDSALREYHTATLIDARNVDAYSNIAKIFEAHSAYDKAEYAYSKIIDVRPSNDFIYVSWGVSLWRQGKYAEATKKFVKAIEIRPRNYSAYNNWGIVLYDLQKYDDAISKFQKTVELNAKYTEAYFNWGLALFQQGKYTEAYELYKEGAEILGNNFLGHLDHIQKLAQEVLINKKRLSRLTEDSQIKHCKGSIEGMNQIIELLRSKAKKASNSEE